MQGNRKGILIFAAVLVAVAACSAFALMLGQENQALAIDSNAVTGVMPGIDREKRLAELQEQLDDGMIAFSVNTNPVFANGDAKGNVLIENPEQNAKLLVAEIYLEDTGELAYQSKAIQPGSYIEEVKLDKALAKGEYPATIYLKGYEEESQEYIGQTGARLMLHVRN